MKKNVLTSEHRDAQNKLLEHQSKAVLDEHPIADIPDRERKIDRLDDDHMVDQRDIVVDRHLVEKRSSKHSDKWRTIWSWVKSIVIALIIGLLLNKFVIQRNVVIGYSMYPNLEPQDQLMVQKVSRYWNKIQRGDIVTLHGQDIPGAHGTLDEDLVKRVVGLPGEEVTIQDGHVFINHEQLVEPYLDKGTITEVLSQTYATIQLAEDEYFVLGDNRTHSKDSRLFGPVPKKAITGAVWFRLYPLNKFGAIDHSPASSTPSKHS